MESDLPIIIAHNFWVRNHCFHTVFCPQAQLVADKEVRRMKMGAKAATRKAVDVKAATRKRTAARRHFVCWVFQSNSCSFCAAVVVVPDVPCATVGAGAECLTICAELPTHRSRLAVLGNICCHDLHLRLPGTFGVRLLLCCCACHPASAPRTHPISSFISACCKAPTVFSQLSRRRKSAHSFLGTLHAVDLSSIAGFCCV